jgi:hypothetical protein
MVVKHFILYYLTTLSLVWENICFLFQLFPLFTLIEYIDPLNFDFS